MTIIYILLPLALILGTGFLAAFMWGALDGQFDDLDTPALRILSSEDLHEKGQRHE